LFKFVENFLTQMVRIYDYYGLEVYFQDKAELPITVFAKRNDAESAMTVTFNNGLVDDILFIPVGKELDPEDRELFHLLVEKNISEIIKAWLDVFVYNKAIEVEVIRSNIRTES
jgi:hypothetical protein